MENGKTAKLGYQNSETPEPTFTKFGAITPHAKIQSKVKVYVDLYSAFLRKAPLMRSDMNHTVLPANYIMPAFTPQPQNITARWLVLILPSHGG